MTAISFLPMKRAIFYVDGYNLYCGLKDAGLYPYIWLNIEWLCRMLVERGHESVSCVRYFTALPKHDPAKADRHRTYLRALSEHTTTIHVELGNFKEVSTRCKVCGAVFRRWEEKRTDVAIAVRILQDAFENRFDVAYLLSADSDMIPSLEIASACFPVKIFKAWFPPGRHSNDIRRHVSFSSVIPDYLIKRCQLPDPMSLPDGSVIHKPRKWR